MTSNTPSNGRRRFNMTSHPIGVRILVGEDFVAQFGELEVLPDPVRLRADTDAAFNRLRELLDRFRQHAERGPGLTRYF